MAIFDDVVYWLPESLPQQRRSLNENYLNLNGATPADSIESATHIITNSYHFEGWKKVEEGSIKPVVITVRVLSNKSNSGLLIQL